MFYSSENNPVKFFQNWSEEHLKFENKLNIKHSDTNQSNKSTTPGSFQSKVSEFQSNKGNLMRTLNRFHIFPARNEKLRKFKLCRNIIKISYIDSSSGVRVRQNSIDENVFQCFNGYNQVVQDINKNKRLLINRRQKDKPPIQPGISMLKKENSVDWNQIKQSIPSEEIRSSHIPINNYWDSKNCRQIPLHKSTNHMFPPRSKGNYLK